MAQAKKGALPLEVWWGVSHNFHWQLHSFISRSGFYHRALLPLHVDEGLFCKKKGEHGGEESTKGQAVTKLCYSPQQGSTARTKDRWAVMASQLKITPYLQQRTQITRIHYCLVCPYDPQPLFHMRRTVHDDVGALLQHLGTVGGSACVLAQVLLADVVESQDTGELCVCLQRPPLRLYHCPLRLWEMTERRG